MSTVLPVHSRTISTAVPVHPPTFQLSHMSTLLSVSCLLFHFPTSPFFYLHMFLLFYMPAHFSTCPLSLLSTLLPVDFICLLSYLSTLVPVYSPTYPLSYLTALLSAYSPTCPLSYLSTFLPVCFLSPGRPTPL